MVLLTKERERGGRSRRRENRTRFSTVGSQVEPKKPKRLLLHQKMDTQTQTQSWEELILDVEAMEGLDKPEGANVNAVVAYLSKFGFPKAEGVYFGSGGPPQEHC